MATTIEHRTITHDGVAIPVSRGGTGRPLVLCPGLTSTQAELSELIGLLRRDHEVVSFDLRGHGRTSAGAVYAFEAFLGDFRAVMTELVRDGLAEPPVLVGHSYGADVIAHYAAESSGSIARLVLIDGANPIPTPFITAADLPGFRALWEDAARERQAVADPARRVVLTGREILELNLEIDRMRSGLDLDNAVLDNAVVGSGIIDRYRAIGCPITMIMSTSMAGSGDDAGSRRYNGLWRAGVQRLVREFPHIATSWLDADHGLVVTHAPEIARIIRDTRAADGRPPS
ncbi:alpha/beta hydrolase [Nocardia otitidiscaviarum]|uniref:Alpha/beta hydrolase n=1 Tax=Nocardia otitidiscaviarum TaxID=1823 RepID=A0A516NRX8_9NOCA|nr:alpha/beta fold hydrolase [Nocardia otitidiscaviarum]MCP9620873.1 alpha/beta hydrolase [Nocardia otitidiscaviarum]QDP81658.1 alpha/beta hydrolase [Nocardia otitidiscaviarum]